MEDQMDTILEEFMVFLLEIGQIQSKMIIESYLGNTRQLLVWLFDSDRQLSELLLGSESGNIAKYIIPGPAKTKSIYLNISF